MHHHGDAIKNAIIKAINFYGAKNKHIHSTTREFMIIYKFELVIVLFSCLSNNLVNEKYFHHNEYQGEVIYSCLNNLLKSVAWCKRKNHNHPLSVFLSLTFSSRNCVSHNFLHLLLSLSEDRFTKNIFCPLDTTNLSIKKSWFDRNGLFMLVFIPLSLSYQQ